MAGQGVPLGGKSRAGWVGAACGSCFTPSLVTHCLTCSLSCTLTHSLTHKPPSRAEDLACCCGSSSPSPHRGDHRHPNLDPPEARGQTASSSDGRLPSGRGPLVNAGSESGSRSVVSDSLRPQGLCSPWNSPGQDTGVGSRSLLQGTFPTQGLNPEKHCQPSS